jgi:hypothetical protein
VVEAADIEAEIDVDSGNGGSHPCHCREVVNCKDSEERVAALAPSLETRCVSYPKELYHPILLQVLPPIQVQRRQDRGTHTPFQLHPPRP